MIKIKTAMLAEGLAKELASAKRGANTTKNPTIKQCHQQVANELTQIVGQVLALPQAEVYITELEPKNK